MNSADALVQDCIIEGNSASYYGGGVFFAGGTIRNCLIRNNVSTDGGTKGRAGGLAIYQTGTVSSCTIVSNYARERGGGIYDALAAVTAIVENCIIYHNTCGVYTVTNFYFAPSGGASYSNCCIGQALPERIAAYSSNNIAVDPEFSDWQSGAYHLRPESDCINAGANRGWMDGASDLEGRKRLDVFSGIVDMGCLEHVPRGILFGTR